MTVDSHFNPIRRAPLEAVSSVAASGNLLVHNLIGPDNGARHSIINFCVCPPGQGSPEGLHRHDHEQMFYILSGTMQLEIDGRRMTASRGTLVVTPRGTLHRNWNDGRDCVVFIGFNAPIRGNAG